MQGFARRGGETGPMLEEEVMESFKAFSIYGGGSKTEMDGAHFAKLCRECGLLGGTLDSIAVDIFFTKVMTKVSCLV